MSNTETKIVFCVLLLAIGLTSLAPIVQADKPKQVVTITQTILSTEASCVSGFTGTGFTGFISYCGTTVNTAVTISQETAWITTSQLIIIVLAVAVLGIGTGYAVSSKLRK